MSQVILKQLIKYRLFIKKSIKPHQLTIKNKLILICFLTSLTNKAFLLSQLFFLDSKKNSWFKFNINSNLIKNKLCLFTFNSLKELLYFFFLTKSTQMNPYIFLPLKILNGSSKLELPLSIFNLITKNFSTNCFIIFLFWKQLILLLYSFFFNIFFMKT